MAAGIFILLKMQMPASKTFSHLSFHMRNGTLFQFLHIGSCKDMTILNIQTWHTLGLKMKSSNLLLHRLNITLSVSTSVLLHLNQNGKISRCTSASKASNLLFTYGLTVSLLDTAKTALLQLNLI